MKQARYLFCWDFDNTIVKGHFHGYLFEKGIKPGETSGELIDKFLNTPVNGLKNAEKLFPCGSKQST